MNVNLGDTLSRSSCSVTQSPFVNPGCQQDKTNVGAFKREKKLDQDQQEYTSPSMASSMPTFALCF